MSSINLNSIQPQAAIAACFRQMSRSQQAASAVATLAIGSSLAYYSKTSYSAYCLRSKLGMASVNSDTMHDALRAASNPTGSMAQALHARFKQASKKELEQLIDRLLTDGETLSKLVGLLSDEELSKLDCASPSPEQCTILAKHLHDPRASNLNRLAKQHLQHLPARLKWWVHHLFVLLVKSYSSESGSVQDEPRFPWEAWQKLMFYKALILTPLSIYQFLDLASDYPRVRLAAVALATSSLAASALLFRSGAIAQAPSSLSVGYDGTVFVDMVEEARQGRYASLLGRAQEICTLEQHCAMRVQGLSDKSPIILARPGEGKTALVRGLAQRIANNECCEELKGLRIYSVSSTQLKTISYQNPIGALATQLKGHQSRALVFIDEIHDLASADGQLSADLLPALKTEILDGLNLIGASTLTEYDERVRSRNDKAWEQRTAPMYLPDMPDGELKQLAYDHLRKSSPLINIEEEVMDAFLASCGKQRKTRALPRLVLQAIDRAICSLHISRLFTASEELQSLERERKQAVNQWRSAQSTKAEEEAQSKIVFLNERISTRRAKEERIHKSRHGEIKALTLTLPRVQSLRFRAARAQQGAKYTLLTRLERQIRQHAAKLQPSLDLQSLQKALQEELDAR